MPPRAMAVADHEDSAVKEEIKERGRNRYIASVMMDQEKNRRVTEAAKEAAREMRERKARGQSADALMDQEQLRRIAENAAEAHRSEREVEEARLLAIKQVDGLADLEQLRRAAQGLEFLKEERETRGLSIQYAIQQELKEQDERIAEMAAGMHDARAAEKQSKLENIHLATEAAEQERKRRVDEQKALLSLQEGERLYNQRKADLMAENERNRRLNEDPNEQAWKRSRTRSVAAMALEAVQSQSPRNHFMARHMQPGSSDSPTNELKHELSSNPIGLIGQMPTQLTVPSTLAVPGGQLPNHSVQVPGQQLPGQLPPQFSDPLFAVQQQVLGFIGSNNLPPVTAPFENSPYAMFTKSIMDTFAQAQQQSQTSTNLFHTGTNNSKKSPMRGNRTPQPDNTPSELTSKAPLPPFPQGVPPNLFLDPNLFPAQLFLPNGPEGLIYPPPFMGDPQTDPNLTYPTPFPAGFFSTAPYPTAPNDQELDTEYEYCLKSSRKVRKMTRERQKRVKMNHKFDQLCQMLELGTTNRIEKITILSEAIRSVKQLLRENQFLKGQTVALVARLQQARTEKGNGQLPSFLQVARSTSASSDFGKLSLSERDPSRQPQASPGRLPSLSENTKEKEPKPTFPNLGGLQLEDEEEAEGSGSGEDGPESEVPLVMHDSPLNRFRILDEDPIQDPLMSRLTPLSGSVSGRRLSATFFRSDNPHSDHFQDTPTGSSSSIFSSVSPTSQIHTSSTVCESTEGLDSVFRHSLGNLFGQDEVHLRSPSSTETHGKQLSGMGRFPNENGGTNRFVPNISISVNSANNTMHTSTSGATSAPFPTTPNPLATPTDFEHSKDIFNFISDNDPVHMIFPTSPTKEPLSPINSPTGHHLPSLGPG